MWILIADDSQASRTIEEALRRRGVVYEIATDRYASQFPMCRRPCLVVGTKTYEGVSGLYAALDDVMRVA